MILQSSFAFYDNWRNCLSTRLILFCIVIVITANQSSGTNYRVSDTDASSKVSLASKAPNNFTVRLRLYDGKNSITPWRYPHSVVVTKRLYADVQLRPLRNDVLSADLTVSPRHCYFSTNSDPTAEDHRHVVLESGCSKNNAKIEFYDDGAKTQPLTHAIRFSILIHSFYFENRHFMFLHCKAAVCSTKAPHGHIQICPKEHCQVGQSDAQLFHMFSGPLQPVMAVNAADGSLTDIPEWTVNGSRVPAVAAAAAAIAAESSVLESAAAARCPLCPAAIDGEQHDARSAHGVDALSVVGIATVSFMIGVFLMASLCYIHKITEPSKLAKAKYLQKSFNGNAKCRSATDDRKLCGETTASTCVSFSSNARVCQVDSPASDGVSLLLPLKQQPFVGAEVDTVAEERRESTATLISGTPELSSLISSTSKTGFHSDQLR